MVDDSTAWKKGGGGTEERNSAENKLQLEL